MVGLDDPIGSIVATAVGVEEPAAGVADLTLRQLLTHTSGFAQYENLFFRNQVGSCEEAVAVGVSRSMQGAGYRYSNMNYCVLGVLIEQLTGQDYERVAYERLLTPLGITGMRLAPTHDPGPGEVVHRSVPERNYMEVLGAAGAWVASPADLVAIVDSLDPDTPGWKPLDADTVAEMKTAVNDPLVPDRGYGMGVILYGGGSSGPHRHRREHPCHGARSGRQRHVGRDGQRRESERHRPSRKHRRPGTRCRRIRRRLSRVRPPPMTTSDPASPTRRTRASIGRYIPATILGPLVGASLGIDGGPIFQILAVENLGLSAAAIGLAFGLGIVSLPIQLYASRIPIERARSNVQIFLVLAAIQAWVLAVLVGVGATGGLATVALGITVTAEISLSVLYATAWQPLLASGLDTYGRQRLNSTWPAVARGVLAGAVVLFAALDTHRSQHLPGRHRRTRPSRPRSG